jgi:hypothetical protein
MAKHRTDGVEEEAFDQIEPTRNGSFESTALQPVIPRSEDISRPATIHRSTELAAAYEPEKRCAALHPNDSHAQSDYSTSRIKLGRG